MYCFKQHRRSTMTKGNRHKSIELTAMQKGKGHPSTGTEVLYRPYDP